MKINTERKTVKCISIVIVMTFIACISIPVAASPQPVQNSADQLRAYIFSLSGNPTAEEIFAVIEQTVPIPEALENDMLLAIDSMLGAPVEDSQNDACANATLLFLNGLAFVLVSMVISETVTQETCTSEGCIGDVCVCFQEETTSPLSGLNRILRTTGRLMLVLGIAGYVQNCLLAPSE